MKILVIDDDADTRELVQMSLHVDRIESIAAASGAEGLDRAKFERPDVIVLDVMMPFMDGPATLAALRADPATSDIPVIFLTASVLPTEIERLRRLGAASVLAKPFEPLTLGSQVRAVLAPASQMAAVAGRASRVSSLTDLRLAFVGTSSGRVQTARSAIQSLADDPGAGTFHELMRFFHALAGLGGSHGFPRISTLAKEGELECLALQAAGTRPTSSELEQWGRLVDAIEHELSRPDAGPEESFRTLEAESPGPRGEILMVAASGGEPAGLRPLLEAEGWQVTPVGTRAQARSWLEEHHPSAVVVALRLPDGLGHDLVAHVRSLPGGESVPVMTIGPAATFIEKVEAIISGADAHFESPTEWTSFLARLDELLASSESRAARILSVEDDPEQAAYVKAVLESAGHQVFICSDPARFEALLTEHEPDLVLMDILLPGVTGYDLVRYLRQEERYATLPVLFLTTEAQLQARLRGARVGGDDHLVKPVLPPVLLSAVAARVERSRFLRRLLGRDGLTRLLTHSAFIERARAAQRRMAENPTRPFAWVMIDVDHFKAVNDRFGHPVGDQVLAALAALLRRRFRQSDAVGRYGGEEFAVLFEGLPVSEVVRLMERVRQEFAQETHRAPDGEGFRATFSAGVAMLGQEMSVDAWKQAADDALYAAKAAGRNRVIAAGGEGDGGGGRRKAPRRRGTSPRKGR